MMGTLAGWVMRSRSGRLIMGGVALLAGVAVWGEVREQRGRSSERQDVNVKTLENLRRMNDAGSNVDRSRGGLSSRLRDGKF
jgi:hypothetical protein